MPIQPKLFIKTGTRGQSKFSQIFDYETGFNLSNAIQRTKSVTQKIGSTKQRLVKGQEPSEVFFDTGEPHFHFMNGNTKFGTRIEG